MSEIKDRNPLAEAPKEPDKREIDEDDTKSSKSTIEEVRNHFQERTAKNAWGNSSRPDFVPPTSDIQHVGKFFREVFSTDNIHKLLKSSDETTSQYVVKRFCQKEILGAADLERNSAIAALYLIGLNDRLGYRSRRFEFKLESFANSWGAFRKEKGREPTNEEEFIDFAVQCHVNLMSPRFTRQWGEDREKMKQELKRLRPERIARQLRKNYTLAQSWFNAVLPESVPEAMFVIEEPSSEDIRSDATAFLRGDVQIYEVQQKIDLVVKIPSPGSTGFFCQPDAMLIASDLAKSFEKEKLKRSLKQLKIFIERAIELAKKQRRITDFFGEGNMGFTADGTFHIVDVDLITVAELFKHEPINKLQTGYLSQIVQEFEKTTKTQE